MKILMINSVCGYMEVLVKLWQIWHAELKKAEMSVGLLMEEEERQQTCIHIV